jgi:hypothetical protein
MARLNVNPIPSTSDKAHGTRLRAEVRCGRGPQPAAAPIETIDRRRYPPTLTYLG